MRFFDLFPTPTLFAVIHVESHAQCLKNLHLARGCGAGAVFFINHAMSDKELVDIFVRMRGMLEDRNLPMWMGLNLLDAGLSSRPEDTFRLLPQDARVDGVWLDNMNFDDTDPHHETAMRIQEAHMRFMATGSPNCLLFAPYAFKGQEYVKPSCNSRIAPHIFDFADVLTTSGPGTGHAADPGKITAIRDAIGPDKPMVVASGATPRNLHNYLPAANGFLTFSGIGIEDTNDFNPVKIKEFLRGLRAAQ